ncbi:regulator of G-protein signaling 3-like [Lycodopsis pacificus]
MHTIHSLCRVCIGQNLPQVNVVRGKDGFGFTIFSDCPVKVQAVDPGGPAHRSGLRHGDSVLQLNGLPVETWKCVDLANTIRSCSSQIVLVVWRGGFPELRSGCEALLRPPTHNQATGRKLLPHPAHSKHGRRWGQGSGVRSSWGALGSLWRDRKEDQEEEEEEEQEEDQEVTEYSSRTTTLKGTRVTSSDGDNYIILSPVNPGGQLLQPVYRDSNGTLERLYQTHPSRGQNLLHDPPPGSSRRLIGGYTATLPPPPSSSSAPPSNYGNYQNCAIVQSHLPCPAYGTYVTLEPKTLIFPIFVQPLDLCSPDRTLLMSEEMVLHQAHLLPAKQRTLLQWSPTGAEHREMDGATPEAQMVLGQMLGGIAAMQRDQAEANRQFLGALRAQAEWQAHALEELAARAAAGPPVTAPPPLAGVVLHKMSAADDVQSFLDTFEVTAEACGWPAAEWGVRLLPLLTGEAQTAALGLPPAARHRYTGVRKAVTDCLGLSPEDHRRRFREARLGPEDRPFAFAQRLRDDAARWLQPESPGGAQEVLEKVVLEQFVGALPARTAAWVRYHRPPTLGTAITLAEDHLAVHASGLGDSGTSPADAGTSEEAASATAGAAPTDSAVGPLPPLSRGTDLRIPRHSSQPTGGPSSARAGVLEVWAARSLPEGMSADGGGPGGSGGSGCRPSNALPRSRVDVPRSDGEGEPAEPPVETPLGPELHSMEDFPLEQSRDDTLRSAFDQVIRIDVREVPQASTGFSPFELLFGRTPRGVLDLIKENWEEGPSTGKSEIQYVLDLRAKLHTLGRLSRENLLQAQERQQRLYNRGAKLRQFTPGEKPSDLGVLSLGQCDLLPCSSSDLPLTHSSSSLCDAPRSAFSSSAPPIFSTFSPSSPPSRTFATTHKLLPQPSSSSSQRSPVWKERGGAEEERRKKRCEEVEERQQGEGESASETSENVGGVRGRGFNRKEEEEESDDEEEEQEELTFRPAVLRRSLSEGSLLKEPQSPHFLSDISIHRLTRHATSDLDPDTGHAPRPPSIQALRKQLTNEGGSLHHMLVLLNGTKDTEFRNLQMTKKTKSLAADVQSRLLFLRRRKNSTCSHSNSLEKALRNNRPSTGEVLRWAAGLEALLTNEYGLAVFRHFLRSEFSEENLDFWLAVERFKRTHPLSKMAVRAAEIYDEFISTNASRQVNVDSSVRESTNQSLRVGVNHTTFQLAQDEILGLMESDSYPRFLRSCLYTQLANKGRQTATETSNQSAAGSLPVSE